MLNEDEIDKNSQEIIQSPDTLVYKDLQSIADDLPTHSPRFVLLSYPIELEDGRVSVPYVMIYYLPATCKADVRMLYAGARELMRDTAGVAKVYEVIDSDEVSELDAKLKENK